MQTHKTKHSSIFLLKQINIFHNVPIFTGHTDAGTTVEEKENNIKLTEENNKNSNQKLFYNTTVL